jgi:hypothetical protein
MWYKIRLFHINFLIEELIWCASFRSINFYKLLKRLQAKKLFLLFFWREYYLGFRRASGADSSDSRLWIQSHVTRQSPLFLCELTASSDSPKQHACWNLHFSSVWWATWGLRTGDVIRIESLGWNLIKLVEVKCEANVSWYKVKKKSSWYR